MDETPVADRIDFENGHASSTDILVGDEPPAGASRFLARIVYRTGYAVSFGVTLPVMMIVRIVPRDNALVHGLVDGALAARDNVDHWAGDRLESHKGSVLDEVGADVADNGSDDHEHPAGKARRARSRPKRATAGKTNPRSPRRKS